MTPLIRRGRMTLAAMLCAALTAGSVGFVAFAPLQGLAQQAVLRIAAVVNEDVISMLDLEQRLRLIALSSNLNLNQQTRQRLLPQVLRTMIDERLQMQAAKEATIRVTEREIEEQIRGMEQRNGLQPDQMEPFLQARGIDIQTMRQQLETQIAWQKYAQRRLAREIRISEEEVDEEMARLRQAASEPQKRVYEIFLSVENPDQAQKTAQNAQRLLEQIRQGADFSALARTFSEASSAAEGGDLGWVVSGQLPSELDATLRDLEPGMVSNPIRTLTGYYLLYVTDVRRPGADPKDTTVDLIQITAKIPQNNEGAALKDRMQAATESFESCEALREYGAEQDGMNVAEAEDVRVGDLPKDVRPQVLPLQKGQISQPIEKGQFVLMIGVCDRTDAEIELPSRDAVRARLGNERLELLARRKMRDLRRAAFIDIRL